MRLCLGMTHTTLLPVCCHTLTLLQLVHDPVVGEALEFSNHYCYRLLVFSTIGVL